MTFCETYSISKIVLRIEGNSENEKISELEQILNEQSY